MTGPLHAIKSLQVHDVKVYEVKNQKLSVKTRGKLELLFLPEFDRFLLSLGSFRYVLSPDIFILASLHEKRAYRSYFLPGVKCHYILKLKSEPTAAVLGNLETIFASYSHLTYQEDQQNELQAQLKKEDGTCGSKSSGDYARTMGKYISKGGEGFKQNMFKFANYLGKNMQKKSSIEPQNENQLYVRNIDELKCINDQQAQCIDLDRAKIGKLIELSNNIGKEMAGQQAKVKNGKNDGWNDLKKGTTSGLKSLWNGLDEAATIFGSAMSKKKKSKKDKKDKKDKNSSESTFSPHSQNLSSTDPDSSNSGDMTDFSNENFMDDIMYAPPIPQQETNINYAESHQNMYNVQGSTYGNQQQMAYHMHQQQQQVIYNNVPQQVSYNNGQQMTHNQSQADKSLFGQTEMVHSQYYYVDQNGNQIAAQPQHNGQPLSQPQQSVYFVDTSMHIQVYPNLKSQNQNQGGQR